MRYTLPILMLCLAGCSSPDTQDHSSDEKINGTYIVCQQQSSIVFAEEVSSYSVEQGVLLGTTVEGKKFVVMAAACTIDDKLLR